MKRFHTVCLGARATAVVLMVLVPPVHARCSGDDMIMMVGSGTSLDVLSKICDEERQPTAAGRRTDVPSQSASVCMTLLGACPLGVFVHEGRPALRLRGRGRGDQRIREVRCGGGLSACDNFCYASRWLRCVALVPAPSSSLCLGCCAPCAVPADRSRRNRSQALSPPARVGTRRRLSDVLDFGDFVLDDATRSLDLGNFAFLLADQRTGDR